MRRTCDNDNFTGVRWAGVESRRTSRFLTENLPRSVNRPFSRLDRGFLSFILLQIFFGRYHCTTPLLSSTLKNNPIVGNPDSTTPIAFSKIKLKVNLKIHSLLVTVSVPTRYPLDAFTVKKYLWLHLFTFMFTNYLSGYDETRRIQSAGRFSVATETSGQTHYHKPFCGNSKSAAIETSFDL